MEREQIIKALECCTSGRPCRECDFKDRSKDTFGCRKKLLIDALAIILTDNISIRLLTEENERLRGIGLPDDETYIKLSDAKHAIMNYVGEQTVSKYASSEVCKAVRDGAEGAMNELDYITPASVAPIADTVRKMQKRLYPLYKVLCVDEGDWRYEIDQIAKEMVEEGD